MMRRRSSSSSGKCLTKRRTRSGLGFDEFGFALSKRKDRKLQYRSHDYSYPQPNAVRVKELCELLSYWNGSSFICRSQIERFIRVGIPPALRGRVWKCLLNIDALRESSAFNYQACLIEIRRPLVDLGVSEYSIISAITTLSDAENDMGSSQASAFASADVALFRQIALDLQRSFPTHQSLMGESPEAIEGQAKLFRVLTAYAKYNPQIGYSQGMSYIAAVLLMNLTEEEAFWALVALLEKPKYLSELFDHSLKKIQHQAVVFHQLIKHRKPVLFQHIESVGVSSLHYVMPWFLTLFTSLPCWDSVLAVWDLIMLHGISAVFRTGLTIMQLLEPRLMSMTDEASVLPILLRVPVDVSQHYVLVPALWSMEVQDWEINCMNSLVLEDASEGHCTDKTDGNCLSPLPSEMKAQKGDVKAAEVAAKKASKKGAAGSASKSLFARILRVAQRCLSEAGRQNGVSKPSPAKSSPATSHFPKASTSLPRTQIRTRRRSQRGLSQHAVGGMARKGPHSSQDSDGGGTEEGSGSGIRRLRSGPVGRVARRRSSSGIRGKSLLLWIKTPHSSTPPPPNPTCGPPEQTQRTEAPLAAPHREQSLRRPAPGKGNSAIRSPTTASLVRESQLI